MARGRFRPHLRGELTPILSWTDVEQAFAQARSVAAPLAVALVSSAIPLIAPRARTQGVLLGLGVLSAIAVYRQAALGLAAVAGLVYLVGYAISRQSPTVATAPSRWKLACAALGGLAVLFFGLQWIRDQESGLQDGGRIGLVIVGFNMWTALRLTTFFWEIGSGRVHLPSVRRFCLWLLYPFALAAGPVIRLSEFEAQTGGISPLGEREPPGRWLAKSASALGQLVLGYALAALSSPLNSRGVPGRLAIVLVIAPWGFLLQAAGYMQLMETFSRTWNVTLPPSFNRPFGRPNLSEFWANWNMTATSVFRDYLFYNRWGRRRPNVYVNSLILFVLVGAWHAVNAYWLLWGLIHGIGFCVYMWYKQRGTTLHALFRGGRGQILAITLTYLFVAACWALPPQLMKLSRLF